MRAGAPLTRTRSELSLSGTVTVEKDKAMQLMTFDL